LDFSYTFSYKDIDRGILEFFGALNLVKTIEQYFIKIKQIQPAFFIQMLSSILILIFYVCMLIGNSIAIYKFLMPFFILTSIIFI